MRKKSIHTMILLSILSMAGYGQQQELTPAAITNWKYLSGSPRISRTGKYVVYSMAAARDQNATAYIKEIDGAWQKEIPGLQTRVLKAGFDATDRYFVYRSGRGIRMQQLGGDESFEIPEAGDDFLLSDNAEDPYLLYTTAGVEGTQKIAIYDFLSKQTTVIDSVKWYRSTQDSKDLMYVKKVNGKEIAMRYHLPDRKTSTIATGAGFDMGVINSQNNELAFIERAERASIVWRYNLNTHRLLKVGGEGSFQVPGKSLGIRAIRSFAAGGQTLVLELAEKVEPVESANTAALRVYGYSDQRLATVQPKQNTYFGLCFLKSNSSKVVADESGEQQLQVFENGIIRTRQLDENSHSVGRRWSKWAASQYLGLIATADGKEVSLASFETVINSHQADYAHLSLSGNHFVFQSEKDYALYSYEIQSGKLVKLTASFSKWINTQPAAVGDILICQDGKDIWQVDMTGKKKALCLTNLMGSQQGLSFSFVGEWGQPIQLLDSMLVSVYHLKSKQNGFAWIHSGKQITPALLSYGPEYCFAAYEQKNGRADFEYMPVKAANANRYLFAKQHHHQSPNLYVTENFSTSKQLTAFYPERAYKDWTAMRLINWKNAKDSGQALLYLPANFDSTKKYPVVVDYYADNAYLFNTFHVMSLTFNGAIQDVSILTRQGYLVCVPDIPYVKGGPGRNAFAKVMGATDEIVKLSFVDSSRMAVTGHSFGGYETNFMVTHTTRFKAAYEGAGGSDLVAKANHNDPPTHFGENGQYNLGSSIWERPDLYLDNSPIHNADKVATPILIMHNPLDRAVLFTEGMQWFGALYRLGKPAWMLEYKDEGHVLSKEENKQDLTRRILQFFDHYLKDKPAPQWMLNELSSTAKASEQGFELSTDGRQPGPSVLTESEKKKIEQYSKIPFAQKLQSLLKSN